MSVQINTAPMYYKDPQTGQYVPVVGIQGPRGIQGIPGKGIKSIQKTGTSGQTDTYTITYDDDTTSTYQLVNEANGEAYGAGTRNGVPVTSGDPAYEKNAPYFAGLARKYTDGKGLDGTIDPAFNENNAKYQFQLTKAEADRAKRIVDDAEQDISDAGTEQVQAVENKGQEVLDSIPADYTELSVDVDSLKSAVETGYVLNNPTSNGAYANNGNYTVNSKRIRTDFIAVKQGDKIVIENGSFVHFCGAWNGDRSTQTLVRSDSGTGISADEEIVSAIDGWYIVVFAYPNTSLDVNIEDFDGYVRLYNNAIAKNQIQIDETNKNVNFISGRSLGVEEKVFRFKEIQREQSAQVRLMIDPETGLATANTFRTIYKFIVLRNQKVKIISEFNFQFQSALNTPTSGESTRIGETYSAGEYVLEVPDGASYIAVTETFNDPRAKVYSIYDVVDPDAEAIARLDAVTKLTEQSGVQLVDKSLYTLKAYGNQFAMYGSVRVDLSNDGVYTLNPLGKIRANQVGIYAEDGTLLAANGRNSFEFGADARIEKISATTIRLKTYRNTKDAIKDEHVLAAYDWVFDGEISYAILGRLYTDVSNDRIYDMGMTFNYQSTSYVPFGKSIALNDDFPQKVWSAFETDRFFERIPDKSLTPWMQRSYAKSDNLFDDRLVDWDPDSSYYLQMKAGESFPVEGGRIIMSNVGLDAIVCYDENDVATNIGNKGAQLAIQLPADAVKMRFGKVWQSSVPNGYIPVYIYYCDRIYPTSSKDQVPLPMAQMNGWDINKNLYDYCIPDEDSTLIRMIKTFAVREINHRQNAFRFGTFNVFVQRSQTNKTIIRKELETYGVDFCGFQESQNITGGLRYNLGDYLKGWQFGYCSTAEEDTASARHIVSRYEILSSEAFSIGTGTNTCLKCVIQLPRYKDYYDGFTTLSFYTYHGLVSSDSEREIEVNNILSKVAQDTSDFIVVTGDTNDFSGQPNYRYDRWKQFEAAGLSPIHWGESSTITEEDPLSIDNMFVSKNIKCLYYDVINSKEWMYTPPGATAPLPVSDHDFVYADLQFDFETAIAERRAGS